MHMETLMLRQPSLHLGMLVRRIVIHDQMQLKVFGGFLVDFFEEGQPLLMAVLALDATDQFAQQIIQCGEQRDRAGAGVIMGFCLDMADPQR